MHQPAYQGSIPRTGAYQCNLCGTSWDDQGNVTGRGPGQLAALRATGADAAGTGAEA